LPRQRTERKLENFLYTALISIYTALISIYKILAYNTICYFKFCNEFFLKLFSFSNI